MKRLLSLLLALGFLTSFIGHGWAHSGLIKEDACLLCCAAPAVLQAEPRIAAPQAASCAELDVPRTFFLTGVVPASAARAPPRA